VTVLRIVPNVAAPDTAKAQTFYGDLLGLEVMMDLGWIVTFATDGRAAPQISIMSEGGSGAPVPDISIEVENVDEVYRRAVAMGLVIEYELTDEPWGVRRFFLRDPFGRLVNILSHL
jgi:catechol 2,3-dioxygenase-like lactoylglutathione lyase family enzyme